MRTSKKALIKSKCSSLLQVSKNSTYRPININKKTTHRKTPNVTGIQMAR
jgi:hypothetical protein